MAISRAKIADKPGLIRACIFWFQLAFKLRFRVLFDLVVLRRLVFAEDAINIIGSMHTKINPRNIYINIKTEENAGKMEINTINIGGIIRSSFIVSVL